MKIYNKLVDKCKELNLLLDKTTSYDSKEEFAHAAVFRMLSTTNKNKIFLDKYNITSVNDFYRLSTMDNSFPLYIDMNIVWPTIDVLSKIIHDNGDKLFLAHPYKYSKDNNIEILLNSCVPYIDGIEICNEPKNEKEVNYLYQYADKKGLLICAGSNFHESEKHNNEVVDYLDDEMKKEIISWINEVPGKIKTKRI